MKNLQLNLMMALCIFSFNAYSQNFYLEINAGYGFPLPGSHGIAYAGGYNVPGNTSYNYFSDFDNNINTNTESQKQISHSYGTGINLGGTMGYNFNKYLGTEIGFSYLFGSDAEATYSDKDMNISGGTSTYQSYEYTYTFRGNMFQFVPSIVLNAGLNKINPYVKLGAIVGFGGYEFNSKRTSFGKYSSGTSSMTREFNEGVSLGFNTKAGVLIGISDQTSLFVELNINNVAYSPNKAKVTEYSIDGVDELQTLPTREKEIEFVKDYSVTVSNYNYPDDVPRKDLKFSVPFGFVGFNVGLRVLLGGPN